MSEIVIVAVLSLAGTLAGSFFGANSFKAVVNVRLDQIEKRLDRIESKSLVG